MYSRKFWDNIYINHYEDAPWMDDTCKIGVFDLVEEIVSPLLNHNIESFTLLDYGCGNGHMGLFFSKKGVKVDLTDISAVLVERLKQEYANESNVNIFETETPEDLPKNKRYNVVIAWNVFHHLNPDVWSSFLKVFFKRMKPDGLLMISGWDKEDEVIRQDHNIAKYTGHETWYINDLPNHIDKLSFDVVKNELLEIFVPEFNTKRKFRLFLFKKVKHNHITKTV